MNHALENDSTPDSKATLGFWIYLMTDAVVFATLFATYAVMHKNTFGGPGASELFDLPFALAETLVLLTSSLTCGLAVIAAKLGQKRQAMLWLAMTFVLGALFLGMELYEFIHLISEGNSWTRSGFLSAFFTLLGTHGIHIATGLVWLAVMFAVLARSGLNQFTVKRLVLLSMFWHMLDVVWIFIFTFVYLMGAS